MTFRVGQKVVCVSAEGLDAYFYPGTILPAEGVVYTVRELLAIEGRPLLRLSEIKNHQFDFESGVFEPAFHRRRFRPVVERKTDISILEALLNPADERVEA